VDVVDHSRVIVRRQLVLHLEDFPNGGINAAMSFDGVPIGISDGLAENRRFRLARFRVSGCPDPENALGAW